VNEEQCATDIGIDFWSLFDHGIFAIMVEPKTVEDTAKIERIIIEELDDLARNGIRDDEFMRGLKNIQINSYNLIENSENCAYEIGHIYLATGDENYVFTALEQPHEVLKQQAEEIIRHYFRPVIMHKGLVAPLPESERDQWLQLQEQSDEEDQKILSARVRKTTVGEPVYANNIVVQKPVQFIFPKPQTYTLSNGLKVLYYHDATTPKINILLELKARPQYDLQDKQGLYRFVTEMMMEGTAKYSSEELADAIESRGMSLEVCPGGISMEMLSADFSFGLDILNEVVTHATFPDDEIEKIRDQTLSDLNQYWDEPNAFIGHLAREVIYKNHPYSKQALGTVESLSSITRQDLINFYKKYISLSDARIAVVGDLGEYDLQNMLEITLGNSQSTVVETIEFPQLFPVIAQEINYPINRDQVVLCFAQLSINRTHPDFDKYLLFDQIFDGGVLGSMNSRLKDLRQQTGLFYTISGSLMHGADEQPGTFQVRTIVSLDRLAEAEVAIKKAIDTASDVVTEEELDDAKRAVINTLIDNFASNNEIASTFLFLDRFNFPADYFDNRAAQLEKITLNDVKAAVKKILSSKNIITVRAGRV
jgi:zinc protease